MNLDKLIVELRVGMQTLDKVIAVIEDLSGGHPGSVTRKRKPFSAAARKKMARAQQKRRTAERKHQLQLLPKDPPSR